MSGRPLAPGQGLGTVTNFEGRISLLYMIYLFTLMRKIFYNFSTIYLNRRHNPPPPPFTKKNGTYAPLAPPQIINYIVAPLRGAWATALLRRRANPPEGGVMRLQALAPTPSPP
jgi:hypothetical protein